MNLPTPQPIRYTLATPQPSRRGDSLQKTGGGFGDLLQPHDESRGNLSAETCGFVVCASSFGGSDGRPARACRFPQGLSGSPTRSSRRPCLATGAVVVANHSPWRPIMALAPLGALAPVLAVVNGTPTTTSADVARHFGKRHDDVLKAIRNLLPQLPDGGVRNFAETPYTDPQNGQQYPAYRLSRDGFTLLAMGFTGKRALAFKLAYIDAFNRMEAELAKARALLRLYDIYGQMVEEAKERLKRHVLPERGLDIQSSNLHSGGCQ